MKAKPLTANVVLIYPGFKIGDPAEASAEVEARITPTQLIVVRGYITTRAKPNTFPQFRNVNIFGRGGGPMRFYRKNGNEIGSSWAVRGWQVAGSDLKRINEQVARLA